MASGHPQWISRMLQPTMASASTAATSSSQLTGEPQSRNAGAERSSGIRFAPGGHRRSLFVGHRGTGFAGPLVSPPGRGLAKRHEVREDWGAS